MMAFSSFWKYCAPLSLLLLVSYSHTARGQAVQAENVTVLEGGTAQISCRLQNYDGSIVVIQNPRRQTLFFNGTRALKDDRFQMVLFSQQLVRITLTNVSVSDEGGYFCQLYTDDTHHQVATLSVVVPPEMPTVEVKTEAVEGGEVELTCLSPRSKPPATLRWVRDRREIPGVISQQENGKTVSVSNTIRIPVERKDNGAALSCEASHPALVAQKRVRHYSLDVHFAPTVKIIPPQGILREGDSLSLTCSVTGNPLPRDIQWSRVNDTLPERAEKTANILQVSRLSQSHNGTYLCQAHNNYGRAADHYTLLVYVFVPPNPHPAIAHPTLPSSSFAKEYEDPGAVVETHSAVPYAVIGGILALLVFTVICVLIVTIWCSVRQKGSYLTHEASGLDEHGEVQEAFLNGNDASQGKKEYLL
ncbi:cell adhesion molecule 4 isoform X2 [Pimephales promelas]|uniref:cell adhesion molecule 4 isoform X2 n=1 Tax=Pimephales promelas TaxID=90988 RepID=UPI001955D8DB|nr:cell adhesion molecule 4 isoform X2 [Pimephales promelas]KAG1947592.1 cell adhesion molecule [Pimephales promelas]